MKIFSTSVALTYIPLLNSVVYRGMCLCFDRIVAIITVQKDSTRQIDNLRVRTANVAKKQIQCRSLNLFRMNIRAMRAFFRFLFSFHFLTSTNYRPIIKYLIIGRYFQNFYLKHGTPTRNTQNSSLQFICACFIGIFMNGDGRVLANDNRPA